jgi:hypothetical protein
MFERLHVFDIYQQSLTWFLILKFFCSIYDYSSTFYVYYFCAPSRWDTIDVYMFGNHMRPAFQL